MPPCHDNHQLLFIAYFFPPLGGAGVQRSLKFAKYLPDFGWIPHVITSEENCNYLLRDESLLNEFRDGSITRIRELRDPMAEIIARFAGFANKPLQFASRKVNVKMAIRNHLLRLRWLEIPDEQIGWALRSYYPSLAVIKKHQIEAIFTSSSPYSSHLLGFLLKKRTGLPWVADFRDEWIGNPYIQYPTKLHLMINRKLERDVVTHADHVITVTEPILGMLKQGAIYPGKFSVITNGFDIEDFSRASLEASSITYDGKFHLTYTGNLYDSPDVFFMALANLIQNGKIPKTEICLHLIGALNRVEKHTQGLEEILDMPGYLNHIEAIKKNLKSDVLLMYLPIRRGLNAFTGKIFEYLAAGKTILALIPETSILAKLIQETQSGVIVSPDDYHGIQEALLSLFVLWRQGGLKKTKKTDVLNRFERRYLTSCLANILDQVIL